MISRMSSRRPGLLAGLGLTALLGLGITAGGVLGAQGDRGWFTADQATRGHVTFNSYCAQCHRPDLKGAMGPALVGGAFLNTWLNRPVTDLYNFEHANMPVTNPGSVPEDKLWRITAYILQKNGFPAGSTPLNAQTAANRTLVKPPA